MRSIRQHLTENFDVGGILQIGEIPHKVVQPKLMNVYIAFELEHPSWSLLDASDLSNIEKTPHLTFIYGETSSYACFDIPKMLQIISDSFQKVVRADELSLFVDAPERPVMYRVSVDDGLAAVREMMLKDFSITSTHPVWTPHVTVGYAGSNLKMNRESLETIVGTDFVMTGIICEVDDIRKTYKL